MAQNYTVITSTTKLSDSLVPLTDRDDSDSNFSGTAFPSSNILLGMFCYRTDQLKLYQLTNLTGPVWTLIYDLSSGIMLAPAAAAVAWSSVSGRPTTIAGYGITDALNKSGDSATGKITFLTPTAAAASVRLPHGVFPSAPLDGDMWSTTAGFYVRQNGGTYKISFIDLAETYTAKKTYATSSTGSASLNIPAGSAPSAPAAGDLWATSSQLVYNMAGTSRNVAFWDGNSRIPVANGGTGAGDQATARANLGIVDMPAGVVAPFAGTSEPSGWCFCDGRVLAIASYPALFAAIGATYGGDGSTTFAIPDLRGRVPAGKNNMGVNGDAGRLTAQANGVNGWGLGQSGGAETHTLTVAQMPSHQHNITYARNQDINGGGGQYPTYLERTGVNKLTDAQGGNQGHNNVQPTIILHYIIKLS